MHSARKEAIHLASNNDVDAAHFETTGTDQASGDQKAVGYESTFRQTSWDGLPPHHPVIQTVIKPGADDRVRVIQ